MIFKCCMSSLKFKKIHKITGSENGAFNGCNDDGASYSMGSLGAAKAPQTKSRANPTE